MSPPFNVFLTPSGKFEASRVRRTLTSGLARGLGVHEYHSLIGATNVAGTPFRIGCAGSSAFTRAGAERTHRLLREQEVIELAALCEERQHFRARGLGLPPRGGQDREKAYRGASDRR